MLDSLKYVVLYVFIVTQCTVPVGNSKTKQLQQSSMNLHRSLDTILNRTITIWTVCAFSGTDTSLVILRQTELFKKLTNDAPKELNLHHN